MRPILKSYKELLVRTPWGLLSIGDVFYLTATAAPKLTAAAATATTAAVAAAAAPGSKTPWP